MPIITTNLNLRQDQEIGHLVSDGLPTRQWGILGPEGDGAFITIGRSGTNGVNDGGPFFTTGDNLDIKLRRLGIHEPTPNSPAASGTLLDPVGNLFINHCNIQFLVGTISTGFDVGGANRQSYTWDDVVIYCTAYNPSAGGAVPFAQEMGNWISRVPADGSTPVFPAVNPTYKFDNVSFIPLSANEFNGDPATDNSTRVLTQLTFRASAVADDSEFVDINCWNGIPRSSTYVDSFTHTRSNVAGGTWIGATYVDYGRLVVPPIGANQIITPQAGELVNDLRVVGFSNQGNQLDLAASEGGKYSYTNHYGIIDNFDCRSLQETPDFSNFQKYTIEVSNDANIWFINPLLGSTINNSLRGNLDMTFLANTSIGEQGSTAITSGGIANQVIIFHYNVTPLSVSGNFVQWYNLDRTFADVNALPTAGNPIVSSDKLNVVIGHAASNLEVEQLVDDVVAGGNLSQQLGDPYPNGFNSITFTKTSSTALNVIGAFNAQLSSATVDADVDWTNSNENMNVSVAVNDVAFTTYNGIGVAKVLVATSPTLSDIGTNEVGYHILTEDSDRTKGIFPITSSSFTDRTIQPTEVLSVVYDDTTDNLAVARVNQDYIGGIPNSGRLEQFTNLSGRFPNYVELQPLDNWDYRHYAWAQQPDRAEFGNQKSVVVPPLGATDVEVISARRNGFSFRNIDGTWSDQVDINDTADDLIAGLGHFDLFEARSKIIQTLQELSRRVGNVVPLVINTVTANGFTFSAAGSEFTIGNIGLQNALVVGGQTIRNSANPYTITIYGIADQSGEINFRDAITVSPGDTVEFHQFYEANVPAGALTGIDLMGVFKGKQLNRVLLDTSETVTHYELPYDRQGHALNLGDANLTFVFPGDDASILVEYLPGFNTWTIPTTRLNRDENNIITEFFTTGRVTIDARIVNELTFSDIGTASDLRISNIEQSEAVRYSLYNTVTEASSFEGVIPAGGEVTITFDSSIQNQLYRLGVTGQIYDDFISEIDGSGQPLIQTGLGLLTIAPILSVNPNEILEGVPSPGGLTPQVNETVAPGKIILATDLETTWNAIETVQGLSFLKFQTNHYVEIITRLNQPNLIFVQSDSTVAVNNEYFIFSQEDGTVVEESDPASQALDTLFNDPSNTPRDQLNSLREYHPTDDRGGGAGYENGFVSMVLNIPDGLDLSVITVGTSVSSGTSTASLADSIEFDSWNGTILFTDIDTVLNVFIIRIGFDTIADRDFVANTLESVSEFRTSVATIGQVSTIGFAAVFATGLTTGNVNGYYRQGARIYTTGSNAVAQSSWFIATPPAANGGFTIDAPGNQPSTGDSVFFRSSGFTPIEDSLFSFSLGSPEGTAFATQPANSLHPKTVGGVTVQRYKGPVDLFTSWAGSSVQLACPVYLTNVVLTENPGMFPFSRISQIIYLRATVDFAVENRTAIAGGASETFITGVEQNLEAAIIRARNVVIGTR